MTLRSSLLLLGGTLFAGAASLLPSPSALAADIPPADKPGWTLTFEDTFPGPTLDASKWNPGYRHHDIINNELQAYVPTAFTFGPDGFGITAKKEQALYGHGKTMEYTSGAMTTLDKFSQKYGWFEIRCRMLKGKGFWPAFWLLPVRNVWPPEIDVFENLGHENHSIHCTVHWKNADGKHAAKGYEYKSPTVDYTEDFHTFAIDWEPDSVAWYIDGQKVTESTKGAPDEPMYLLVNLAVGGGWPGSPNADTVFPSTFMVSYVRAYSKDGGYPAPASAAADSAAAAPTTAPAPAN